MASIVLLNKCNLNCSYCFSNELYSSETESFNVENFIKAVNFIKTQKNERIAIVGGEPTIHPQFEKFMNILKEDIDILSSIIFTNGIELDKYIEILKHPKFQLLINCNSHKNISNLYNKLVNNIKILKLSPKKDEHYTLGINLYSPDMDYSFIFDLLKLTNQHILRFSIATSNDKKEKNNNVIEYYKQFIPILIKFYHDCLKNEIVPYLDCSGFPFCIFTKELKKAIDDILNLQKRLKYNFHILGCTCKVKVDILSNLTAIRSICFPYYNPVPINKFNNLSELKDFLYRDVDSIIQKLYVDERCKSCMYKKQKLCPICYSHLIKDFKTIKKI